MPVPVVCGVRSKHAVPPPAERRPAGFCSPTNTDSVFSEKHGFRISRKTRIPYLPPNYRRGIFRTLPLPDKKLLDAG